MASGAARSKSGQPDGSRADKPRSGQSHSGDSRSTGRVIEYQAYIDGELRKTRSRVKWVDIGSSLTLLVSGVLGYLLLAAVIDHWVVPGGLGFFGRLLLCTGLVGGIAYHLVARFAPILLRKVSSVYAADAIERGQPMKNSLINFLLLRKQPNASSESMIEAMKEQAAVRLSAVPADAPVDRTVLIRLGYVLCAVLIAAVVYAIAGPKDALRSVNRVIAPWADLAPSTRVRIMELAPEDVERRRDEVVEIKVRTRNMRATDDAAVYYSTSGKPEDDIAVPLRSDDVLHWTATIPGGSEGLKQDLYYYVKLGDAESPRHRIRVLATPVITVGRVEYQYPAYTGLPPRIVERQGDLKGLEGTRVVLTAETNQRMRSAYVTFDASRNRDVELTPDESKQKAIGSFELALAKDRRKSAHESYLLRFANVDGQENPKPIQHRIDVMADQPPELKVLEPTTPTTQILNVPMGAPLRITLSARDPDFQLAELAVVFDRSGAPLREVQMLRDPRYGDFSNTTVFEAGSFGLKVGDRVTFRGRAKDNKAPQPNVAETTRYTIMVVQGDPNAQQPNGQQQNGPQNQGRNGQPQKENDPKMQPQANLNKQGDMNRRDEGQNGNGEQQPNGNDPANDGRQGQPKPGQQGNGKPEQGQPQNDQPQNGQPNDPQNNAGRQNDGRPNKEPGAGDQRPGESQDGQGKPDGQNGGAKPGEKPGEQGGANEKPIDPESKPGDVFEELKKHFDKQDGKTEQKPGQQEQAGREGGDKQNGEQKPGDQQGDGKQPGAKQPNENGGAEPKENPSGEQPGKGEPKQGQPGAEQKPGMNDGPKQGNEKGSEKGTEKGPENGSEKGSEKGSNEATDPNGKGGKPEDENGKKEAKNDGEPQAGAPSGAGKQSGGGEGKQGGDESSGGSASGKQSDRPGSQAGSPGGNEGMRADDKAQGGNERREGKNDGGREIDRKPTDGNGGRKTEAPEDRKPGDTTGAKPADQQGGQPAGEKPGTDAPMPGTGTKPSDSGNQSAPKTGTANEGNPTPDREGKQSNSGDGGESGSASSKPGEKPGAPKTNDKPGDQPDGEQPDAKPSANHGQPAGNKPNPGDVGGGKTKSEGSPEAQETNKPRDKTGGGDPGSKDESNGDEGKSPSGSKHESDAKGNSSGDRSGDGEEGGGMKSKKEGTGSAGSNTPGDKGSGAADEEGDSVAGNKPGDKAKGKAPQGSSPQGKPSGEKGDGNQSREGGDEAGGSGEASKGSPGGEQPNDKTEKKSSEAKPGDQPQESGSRGDGGGGIPKGPNGARGAQRPELMGDASNVEQTKKVTDLVLDRLKAQLDKGQVDPELAKKFGGEEALQKFAKNWDEMRRAANEPGAQGDAARKQYQDTLKGLGLQSGTAAQQGRRTGDDDSRGLVGSRRSEPPAKFADQYRAYRTSLGNGPSAGQAPAAPAKNP